MKILVAVKRVADPDNLNKIKLSGQGAVDVSALEPKANPYDEYALETALRLTENGTNPKQRLGEVTVVTLAPKTSEQMLRAMLGTGADRAIRVDAADDELDGGLVARALKAIVDSEKPDLVLLGYQQTEHESCEVGAMLAEQLGWPQATFAGSIKSEADKALVVGREVDGATAFVRLSLPGVVTVIDKIVHPKSVQSSTTPPTHAYQDGVRFAALMAIMAAKKKPLIETKLSDLVPEPSKRALRVRYTRAVLAPARSAGVKVKTVKELVAKLRTEAKVL
ncbi:MAG TPA: electron transfer flavoprotein subunit beta/FixA family protein [Polyangiaceae bacterium]|nr:electron transfer flavoprotein subunit beta/FixA family protein [Polyangiaceae bacterium]